MEEVKEDVTPAENNKLNSRKFIVFVIGSVIVVSTLIYGFFTKETELVKSSLESYLFIAGFYTGGNCFNKWVNSKKEEV